MTQEVYNKGNTENGVVQLFRLELSNSDIGNDGLKLDKVGSAKTRYRIPSLSSRESTRVAARVRPRSDI